MLMPGIFGESLLDDFMRDFPGYGEMEKPERKPYPHRGKDLMKTDIKETEKTFELDMELPGYKKEEIQVSLEKGYLTVHAVKNTEQKEEKAGKYIRKERYTGACERSFYVGEDTTHEDIKAEFSDGVLKLNILKKEAKPVVEQNKYITIG